ncbi:MAG: hypothetical protein QM757_01530 [Paludibaculum sp.]
MSDFAGILPALVTPLAEDRTLLQPDYVCGLDLLPVETHGARVV